MTDEQLKKVETDLVDIRRWKYDVTPTAIFVSADGYALTSNWHMGDKRLQSWWQPPSSEILFKDLPENTVEYLELLQKKAAESFTVDTGLVENQWQYGGCFETRSEYTSPENVVLMVHYSSLKKSELHPAVKSRVPKGRTYTMHTEFRWFSADDAAVSSKHAESAENDVQIHLYAIMSRLILDRPQKK